MTSRGEVAHLRIALADLRRRLGLEELLALDRPAAAAPRRRARPRPPAWQRRRRRTRRAVAPSTGWPSTAGAIRRTASERLPPPTSSTRSMRTPCWRRASSPSARPHSRPSTAARAKHAGVALARRRPCTAPVASGRLGVRSPSRYGTRTRPSAPGGAESARRESSSGPTPRTAAMASSTRAAFSVQTSGRNRPVASANPATMPDGSATGDSHTAKTVPEVPMETTTSPGPAPTPSAAAVLSPVPGPSSAPDSVCPAGSDAPRTRGTPRHVPEGSLEQVEAVLAGEGRPVAGAARVPAIGGERVDGGRAADASAGRAAPRRQVSQSCGRQTAAVARARSGSWRASQRSFVTVNAARGTLPTASAQDRAPATPGPSSSTSASASAAERVSFHRSAGRTTWALSSRQTIPCCWAPTDTAATSSSPPAAAAAFPSADHHASGSTSVPSGCGARPSRTSLPSVASRTTTLQDWVDESIPATRVTGARRWACRPDQRAPRACSTARWSRWA